ncbi:uncharacterized protein [Lolium perenne]|uniref:uncharacterized protein n=1 Tax=Lolium perenne TaxID=4522 RepID=UPI003A998997
MALLCFLLDLRNIPPPLLRLLKQCLLHLANHYAATPSPTASASAAPLPDRLALCYVHHDAARSSPELKISYRPGEKFNIRDFHHAVGNLPLDGFLHEQHAGDVPLQNLFSNRAIYSWATDDISKKVIAICFSAQNTDALRRSLMDASEQCITVEFVMLETEADAYMYDDVSGNSNNFIHRIGDLENCVVRRYSPETQVLNGLVKRWLEELNDDKEETLQAVFVFRVPIVKSVNQVSCNIYPAADQIIDGFPYCQICKCHGCPIDHVTTNKSKRVCPTTSRHLAASDVTDTAVKIGEQTVLFLPTSEGCSDMRRASTSISFDVIERIELASLNEGVIMGKSHVVIPSSNDEVALTDESLDRNTKSRFFYGLCETLFKLDQGLVCSSTCNTETMKIGTLACYYLLQPSEKGAMLLRRLAGSEEILPLANVSRSCNYTVGNNMKTTESIYEVLVRFVTDHPVVALPSTYLVPGDMEKSLELECIQFGKVVKTSERRIHFGNMPKPLFRRFNLVKFIPDPQGMWVPNVNYLGSCLGHAFAECITSRRRYASFLSNNEPKEDVALPLLVEEMLEAGVITMGGANVQIAIDHLQKEGAPLDGHGRVQIKGIRKVNMTMLQDTSVFDLSDEAFGLELKKMHQERTELCAELVENGPVVGLFRAGSDWLRANGEIYHDGSEENVMAVSKKDRPKYVGHAVLLYAFDGQDDYNMDMMGMCYQLCNQSFCVTNSTIKSFCADNLLAETFESCSPCMRIEQMVLLAVCEAGRLLRRHLCVRSCRSAMVSTDFLLFVLPPLPMPPPHVTPACQRYRPGIWSSAWKIALFFCFSASTPPLSPAT